MSNNKDNKEKARVNKKMERLRSLENRDYDIWKFFETHADNIKGSLWTTVTWLVALKSALLAFMLSDQRVMQFTNAGLGLEPSVPTLVFVLSGLGLALAFFTWAVVADISRHVRSNWLRASAAEMDPNSELRSGKIYLLLPLGAVEVFFAVAFSLLMYISFNGSRLQWAVTGFLVVACLILILYKSGKLEDRPEAAESKRGERQDGSP